jgi:hypothetical protein
MAGCHNLEGFEQQEQQRTANQRGANQGLGGGGSHSNGQSQSDVSQNEKWPLVNGPNGPHYIENPNYKDPPWDPGLQGFMAFEGLGYTIAALPTLLPELPAAVEGSQGLRASSTAELRERAAAGIPKPVTVTRPMVGTPRPIGQAVKIEQVVPRTTAQKALITLSVVLKVLGLWN